ncbi:hypothetical protein OX90_04900 [Pseudomonas coronafaciens pv. porri]|uniref:Uncharacterized protein n=1 Tax=Pseudomonas coronafaciens pv. porri TaxID=83964 RepID=A0ABR5JT18_9PSED|nr:hypothetical protein [Pseudomonas coronafaciens]KOP57779.1 hypothetical protein OX88_04400 [Pseudomonas coronafaciens pv. porri]KOP60680.1 hypothetical protein OX90_04900 [Pseudomonas coronafaciens pv. porri]RMU82852.1 hypothetical protein ALP22_200102 [Pseudomonas coronafaciens pv. porri]
MNKLENVRRRLQWLHRVLDEGLLLNETESSALRTAKGFCALDVSDEFSPISYNTVKSVLTTAGLNEFRAHPYGSNLQYFLEMRAACYESVKDMKPLPFEKKALTVADWKEHYRNVLWHSNLCSEAYLALRRDIQVVLDRDAADQKLDYKRIERALQKSSATYFKIVSASPEPFSPELKVV